MIESNSGDYLLSPANDLINTRIHIDDSGFALDKGLFSDNFKSKSFNKNNHSTKDDFAEFAFRIGITKLRFEKLIAPFINKQLMVEKLVANTFLSEPTKRGYLLMYNTKRNYLSL